MHVISLYVGYVLQYSKIACTPIACLSLSIVDVYYRCYMTVRVKVIYCGAPYLSKNETYIYRTLLQRFKEEKYKKRYQRLLLKCNTFHFKNTFLW